MNGINRKIIAWFGFSIILSGLLSWYFGPGKGARQVETMERQRSEETSGQAAAHTLAKQKEAVPPAIDVPIRSMKRETKVDQLAIIVPDESEWRKAGEALAAKIKSKWGIQAQIESASEDLPDIRQGPALLLGNLGNNGYLSKLYAMKYTFADAVYPGKGGYQLQTLIQPFGHGSNIVVLAASDLAGLQKGQNRLIDLLEASPKPELPWLQEAVVSSEISAVLKPLSNVDSLLSKLSPETKSFNATLTVLASAGTIGETYHLTGSELAGQQYKKLMLGFADFLNRYPKEVKVHLNQRENMWTAGHSFYASWYVIEPSPLFTDEERKRIVSAIYLVADANSNDPYLPRGTQTFSRNNHETYPAFSLMSGAIYFRNHYPQLLPIANEWYEIGDRMFRNNTALISRDDGSDYMMHVPITTLDYALMTGDPKFLRQGMRASADLQAIMIDNLGVMAGGGDVVPFGRSSAYHWGHSAILNAATWFYGDPIYKLLLERTRYGPFPDQAMGDLNNPLHRYMTGKSEMNLSSPISYPLIAGYPFDPGVYEDLKKEAVEEMNIPQSDSFHKLGFRQGFGLDDSYLLIDGTGAGAHNHHDANTILRYTDKGRIFIDARDYIERGPQHKNGIIVIKDGVQEMKPKLASVDWLGDVEGIGISLTRLPDMNGADWQRAILSPGGHFYLVFDQINFKVDGRYAMENVWQTLGSVAVHADRFEVTQQGVSMTLQSMDDSELRTYDRYGHFQQYYNRKTPYTYAKEENVLREVKEEKAYRAGDSYRFVNLLSSSKTKEAAAEGEWINGHTIRIKETDKEWLAVWGTNADAEEFHSDGKLYIMDDRILTIAEATRVQFGSLSVRFDEPVFFHLDTDDKTWKAYSIRSGLVQYDESGNPITSRLIERGSHDLNRNALQHLKELLSSKRTHSEAKPVHAPDAAQDGWERVASIGKELSSSARGDLDGDGIEELVLSDIDGRVIAVNRNGDVLWTYESFGRVNEVTVQQLGGKPIVTVAGANWNVHLVQADGTLLWKKLITPIRTPTHGNLIGVTNVRVAYVDGKDQEPWIMVGTSFNDLVGFDRNGQKMYQEEAYYYGIEDMQFADYSGTGKDMGVLGMEYVYPALFKDKAPIQRAIRTTGPGWKVVRTFPDFREGIPAVVLGSKEHRVHLAQIQGNTLKDEWMVNAGGEVNDILVKDWNGRRPPEILVGSSGHQLYSLSPEGRVNWRASVGDRVMKVNAFLEGGEARYLAGADNGKLVYVSSRGAILKSVRFPSAMIDLQVDSSQQKAWVILRNGEVFRTK